MNGVPLFQRKQLCIAQPLRRLSTLAALAPLLWSTAARAADTTLPTGRPETPSSEVATPATLCVPIVVDEQGNAVRDHGYPIVRCVIADRSANDNVQRNNRFRRSIQALPATAGDLPESVEHALADEEETFLLSESTHAAWFDNNSIILPFDLDSLDGLSEVERYVSYYISEGRGRIVSYFARAGRYRALIEDELRAQGAPLDLLWVVAVESGFDPTVRSRAGAAGLWQFMPRTAQSRGLTVDREVDERLDPEIATREGIRYLAYQLERFGSWPLALAAYNAGSGHVRGQIREYGVTELDAMARYGSVYQGARSYAAKIIAIALIARNRAHFGFDSVVEDAPITWDTVEIRSPVRLSLIADAAGTDAADIIALNPALVGKAVPKQGWNVRIPKDSFETFVRNYDRVAERYGTEHATTVLRFGETPGMVAQRYDIPERVLRAVNGFSSSDRVPYGSTLVIPQSSRRTQGAPSAPAASADAPTVVVPAQEFLYPTRQHIFYEVRAQDTLKDIGEFFDVSPHEIAAWNELDVRSTLWSGMVLQLWVAGDRSLDDALVLHADDVTIVRMGTPEWAAWRRSQSDHVEVSRSRRVHKVRPGDTVLRIASRYGVDAKDIVRWNRLSDSGRIVIGQELFVSAR